MVSNRNENLSLVLYVALELGLKCWKIASTVGMGQKPRIKNIKGGNKAALLAEIKLAKQRFGLAPDARVVSLYEAGRDGFWLHRWLVSKGISNTVVDSASIEVSRRGRSPKTDRLDAQKLLSLLIRKDLGEDTAFRPVVVLTPEEEDDRHQHRARQTLVRERTRLSNRIRGLLFLQGVRRKVNADLDQELEGLHGADGSKLSPGLFQRVRLELKRWKLVNEQILQLKRQRRKHLREPATASQEKARRLLELRGIGGAGAWDLGHEVFGPRTFRNRRQVGSYCGLSATPFSSGESNHEQGISHGNRRVRTLAVELAWGWLRFQPNSELSKWFERRFGSGGPRQRKIGIVALARKLVIALWRFVEQGVLPEGCELKKDPLLGV